jgi:hypothetical protein
VNAINYKEPAVVTSILAGATVKNAKWAEILGGCNSRKGKYLRFCRDGDSHTQVRSIVSPLGDTSQLLQETEHFCGRRQQKVAKIVPYGPPHRTKVAGRGSTGLFLLPSRVRKCKQIKGLAKGRKYAFFASSNRRTPSCT